MNIVVAGRKTIDDHGSFDVAVVAVVVAVAVVLCYSNDDG